MKIPYDKKLHFAAGCLIAISGSLIFSTFWGAELAVCAGLLKELYDLYDYGVFDVNDMLVTWLGGLAGIMIVSFFTWLVRIC